MQGDFLPVLNGGDKIFSDFGHCCIDLILSAVFVNKIMNGSSVKPGCFRHQTFLHFYDGCMDSVGDIIGCSFTSDQSASKNDGAFAQMFKVIFINIHGSESLIDPLDRQDQIVRTCGKDHCFRLNRLDQFRANLTVQTDFDGAFAYFTNQQIFEVSDINFMICVIGKIEKTA